LTPIAQAGPLGATLLLNSGVTCASRLDGRGRCLPVIERR
jgi:hypothetical protein